MVLVQASPDTRRDFWKQSNKLIHGPTFNCPPPHSQGMTPLIILHRHPGRELRKYSYTHCPKTGAPPSPQPVLHHKYSRCGCPGRSSYAASIPHTLHSQNTPGLRGSCLSLLATSSLVPHHGPSNHMVQAAPQRCNTAPKMVLPGQPSQEHGQEGLPQHIFSSLLAGPHTVMPS